MNEKLYFGLESHEYYTFFYEEFEAFFNNLLIDEGGYLPKKQARKIRDRGGSTKYGISLNFLKSCSIDLADVNHDGIINEKDIVLLTKIQAKKLYFVYFWNPLYCKIKDIQLANRIFNFSVNTGKLRAIKLLQSSANDCLQAELLKMDGIFGIHTLSFINSIQPQHKIYDEYINNISDYYKGLHKPQFLNGWLRRLKRLLPKSVIEKLYNSNQSRSISNNSL